MQDLAPCAAPEAGCQPQAKAFALVGVPSIQARMRTFQPSQEAMEAMVDLALEPNDSMQSAFAVLAEGTAETVPIVAALPEQKGQAA